MEGTGFVEASRLKAGDLVRTADASILAVSAVEIEYLAEPVSVYDFKAEDWHTYYISDPGVLVHNMCAVTVKGGSIKSESGIGSQQTPHQKALLDLAREAESAAKRGRPISYEEVQILDEWAMEYIIS